MLNLARPWQEGLVTWQDLAKPQEQEELHLAKLHVPWLPIAKLAAFPPISVTCHKVQTGADILQLQPVKELQSSGGAGPVQNGPQLVDEGQSAEDLQA